jgi:hypothetical protein
MVALTGDFHVFAACVTTLLSAKFFSIWYMAKTWYVRALFRILIRHYIRPFESRPLLPSEDCDSLSLGWSVFGVDVVSNNCTQLSKPAFAANPRLFKVVLLAT